MTTEPQSPAAPAADPIVDLLKKVATTDDVRASAWDAFTEAKDLDDLAARLQTLALPDDVKADLWDLKAAAGPKQEPTFRAEVKASDGVDDGTGILGAIGDVVTGAAKGVANTAAHIGPKLWHAVPGVSELVDKFYGEPGLSERAFAEIDRILTPTNTAQKAGFIGEQIVENLIPSKAITSLGTAAVARGAPALAKVMGKTAGAIAPRVAVEAAANAGMAAAQGGDPLTGAIVGGAIPAVTGAAGRAGAAVTRSRLNPTEEAAVEFARAKGIPIDAATATGSDFVSRQQAMASANMGGAGVAETFKRGQEEALERVATELTEQANAGARSGLAANAGPAVDAVGAGERVRRTLTTLREGFTKKANDAYESLRGFETSAVPDTVPVTQQARIAGGEMTVKIPTPMQLAVDVRPAKGVMGDIHQQLQRERELVGVLHGNKARALLSLDALMTAPDHAPLSVVDGALSGLKDFIRVAPGEMRTPGQALMVKAVRELDAAVVSRAEQAGPDVIAALRAGREATKAKYAVDEVLDMLRDGARPLFDQLTARKDGAVEALRAVSEHAPQEVPHVGRAFLEGLLETATKEGGFQSADTLFSKWQNLGKETKRILFPKIGADLDRFFLVNKMIAKNLNKSGTASTLASRLSIPGLAMLGPNWALAKVLYTPSGVRIMTRTIQNGKTNELAAAIGRVMAVQSSKSGGQ